MLPVTLYPSHHEFRTICGLAPMPMASQIHKTMEAASLALGGFVDALHDAVVVVDQNRRIVLANTGVEKMFGYESDELLGKPLNILIRHGLHRAHDAQVANYMEHGHPTLMGPRPFVHGMKKDGGEVALSISLSKLDVEGVRFGLAVIRDASSIEAHLDKALARAGTDVLTGLGNRRYLAEKIRACLADDKPRFSLLFLDLSKFKTFNDVYGHQVGDEALRIVARRIKFMIRAKDAAVRFGGDEFFLLLEGVGEDTLESRVRAIASSIVRPLHIGTVTMEIGVSIGCAIFPRDGKTERELIEKADRAMYQAKQSGEIFCLRADERDD